MKKFFLGAFFLCNSAVAQYPHVIHATQSLPLSLHINPALEQEYKFSTSIANVSVHLQTSDGSGWQKGLTYNKFFSGVGEGNSQTITSESFDNIGDGIFVEGSAVVDIFGAFIKLDNVQLGLFLRDYLSVNATISSGISHLIFQGNTSGDFLRGPVDVNPHLQAFYVRQVGVNGSYSIFNGKLRFGLGLKFNFGLGAVSSQIDPLKITATINERTISLVNSGSILSSGIPLKINQDLSFDNLGSSFIPNFFGSFPLGGVSLDIGITYKLFDNAIIGLSIMNIGPSIMFKNHIRRIQVGRSNRFQFSGVRIINDEGIVDTDEAESLVLDDLIDRAKDVLYPIQVRESSKQVLYMEIPFFTSAFASYKLLENLTFTGLFVGESRFGAFYPSFSLGGTFKFSRWDTNWFEVGVLWKIDRFGADNIGVGIVINLIAIRLHLITDNIIQILNWKSSSQANISFGIGIITL